MQLMSNLSSFIQIKIILKVHQTFLSMVFLIAMFRLGTSVQIDKNSFEKHVFRPNFIATDSFLLFLCKYLERCQSQTH